MLIPARLPERQVNTTGRVYADFADGFRCMLNWGLGLETHRADSSAATRRAARGPRGAGRCRDRLRLRGRLRLRLRGRCPRADCARCAGRLSRCAAAWRRSDDEPSTAAAAYCSGSRNAPPPPPPPPDDRKVKALFPTTASQGKGSGNTKATARVLPVAPERLAIVTHLVKFEERQRKDCERLWTAMKVNERQCSSILTHPPPVRARSSPPRCSRTSHTSTTAPFSTCGGQ